VVPLSSKTFVLYYTSYVKMDAFTFFGVFSQSVGIVQSLGSAGKKEAVFVFVQFISLLKNRRKGGK
jgi:hypothetical protein